MTMRMKSLQFTFLLLGVCLSSFVESADVIKFKGENATMKCHISNENVSGVSLYFRHKAEKQVLFYHIVSEKLTVMPSSKGRVKVKYEGKTLTVDILNLQMQDTGAYWCKCSVEESSQYDVKQSGVLLMVRDRETEQKAEQEVAASTATSKFGVMNGLLVPVVALTASSVLLLLLLVLGVCIVPKIKKMRNTTAQEKKSANEVYEVMTVKREYR